MVAIANPRQVILVTCRGVNDVLGKKVMQDDIIATHWHTPVSKEPKMYLIVLHKNVPGINIIKESGHFVINFIPKTMEKQALFCMLNPSEHISRWDKAGIEKAEAENLECPVVKGAVAYLECNVSKEEEVGDHIVFTGDVTNTVINNNDYRLFHVEKDNFTTTKDM